jgi:transposase
VFAEDVAFVVGGDTHRDSHSLVFVDAASQVVLHQAVIASTRRGYRDALCLARRYAPGRRVWALEGSGCYGAGLARYLADRGERVMEVERPVRRGSRGRIKTDLLDAQRAARSVLAGQAGATPRLGEQTQALRALVVTRRGAVTASTQAINQLRGLLITAPPPLRERLQGLSQTRLVDACSRLRPRHDDSQHAAIAFALRGLARRIHQLQAEARALTTELQRRVHAQNPTLLTRPGIGPISAAELLIAWAQPGRVRNEAAFARLAGVAPIPANSGTTTRHRLDRGGDRHLNHALHTIALTLRRTDPTTQAYIAHRVAHGKTQREATRLLKRYLARSIYRQLEATTTT